MSSGPWKGTPAFKNNQEKVNPAFESLINKSDRMYGDGSVIYNKELTDEEIAKSIQEGLRIQAWWESLGLQEVEEEK